MRRTEPAGFALFHLNFSTWESRPGVWLEDLYVPPVHRRAGVGAALIAQLAEITVVRGYTRLEWAALDWNTPALDFYVKIGAARLDEWKVHRLDRDALARVAGSSGSVAHPSILIARPPIRPRKPPSAADDRAELERSASPVRRPVVPTSRAPPAGRRRNPLRRCASSRALAAPTSSTRVHAARDLPARRSEARGAIVGGLGSSSPRRPDRRALTVPRGFPPVWFPRPGSVAGPARPRSVAGPAALASPSLERTASHPRWLPTPSSLAAAHDRAYLVLVLLACA